MKSHNVYEASRQPGALARAKFPRGNPVVRTVPRASIKRYTNKHRIVRLYDAIKKKGPVTIDVIARNRYDRWILRIMLKERLIAPVADTRLAKVA